MSSSEYLANSAKNLNNIEDGYYIAPAFLDKLSIHVAKNFLDLPKIKVPLILGEHMASQLIQVVCMAHRYGAQRQIEFGMHKMNLDCTSLSLFRELASTMHACSSFVALTAFSRCN